jgi:hypothetical protein
MSFPTLNARVRDPFTSAQSVVLCVVMLVLAPVWIRSAMVAERRYETEWDSSASLGPAETAGTRRRAAALMSVSA